MFGENAATSSEEHAEHFKCGKQISTNLEGYSTRFLHQISQFLDLRKTGYIQSTLELHEDANSTTVLTNRGRSERDLGAVAVTLAIGALIMSVTSLIFYTVGYNDLINHINNLYLKIEEDRKLVNKVVGNIRVLKAGEGQLAIRVNSMYEILHSIRVTHGCALLKQITQVEISRITTEFKLIFNDLVKEELSPRIIPVGLLVKMQRNRIFRGSLIESDLTLFYKMCQIQLVDSKPSAKLLILTITCPRLQRRADFVSFSVMSPPLTVFSNGRYLTRSLNVDFQNLALPVRILQQPNFSLKNLTYNDFLELRKMSGCTMVNNRQFCRQLLPVPPETLRCLTSLTATSGGGSECRQEESVTSVGSLVNYDVGVTGSLIFMPDKLDVRGTVGHLETVLHHGRRQTENRYTCINVPSKFRSVSVLGERKEIRFNQQVSFSFDSVLGFNPKDVFVTKRLFTDHFAEDFRKPNQNFFSLNETRWEPLKQLDEEHAVVKTLSGKPASISFDALTLILVLLFTSAGVMCLCSRYVSCASRAVQKAINWCLNNKGVYVYPTSQEEGAPLAQTDARMAGESHQGGNNALGASASYEGGAEPPIVLLGGDGTKVNRQTDPLEGSAV